jgi:uncharacterized membrane protein (UPF0127 family)
MADLDLNRMVRGLMAIAAAAVFALALPGCEDDPPPQGFEKLTIKSRTYTLELAANDEKRTKGLGERTELPEKGGMLFVFKRAERRQFLMRDCFMDIDIIFLDANGRITAFHHMPEEPPRGADEGEVGDWDPRKPANRRYEGRLKRYSSRGAAQFVVELAGGELEKLKLKVGEKIELDTDRLKALAR